MFREWRRGAIIKWIGGVHLTEKLIGLEKEFRRSVEEKDTAEMLGSGDLPVYGTPGLIAFMEYGAKECLAPYLSSEETTVGISMEMKHVRASLVGADVLLKVKITEASGKKVKFHLLAFEKEHLLGEAHHERVLVNRQKFMDKLHNS